MIKLYNSGNTPARKFEQSRQVAPQPYFFAQNLVQKEKVEGEEGEEGDAVKSEMSDEEICASLNLRKLSEYPHALLRGQFVVCDFL